MQWPKGIPALCVFLVPVSDQWLILADIEPCMKDLHIDFEKIFNPQIGDEHVPGRVRHDQRNSAGYSYLLRRHTTGPKHWDFIISDLHRISVFGGFKIEDPEFLGGANMNGFPMSEVERPR